MSVRRSSVRLSAGLLLVAACAMGPATAFAEEGSGPSDGGGEPPQSECEDGAPATATADTSSYEAIGTVMITGTCFGVREEVSVDVVQDGDVVESESETSAADGTVTVAVAPETAGQYTAVLKSETAEANVGFEAPAQEEEPTEPPEDTEPTEPGDGEESPTPEEPDEDDGDGNGSGGDGNGSGSDEEPGDGAGGDGAGGDGAGGDGGDDGDGNTGGSDGTDGDGGDGNTGGSDGTDGDGSADGNGSDGADGDGSAGEGSAGEGEDSSAGGNGGSDGSDSTGNDSAGDGAGSGSTGNDSAGDGSGSGRDGSTDDGSSGSATEKPSDSDGPAPSAGGDPAQGSRPDSQQPPEQPGSATNDFPAATPGPTAEQQRSAALAVLMTSLFANGVSSGEVGTSPEDAHDVIDPSAEASETAGDDASGEGARGDAADEAGADAAGSGEADGDELAETGTNALMPAVVAGLAILGGAALLIRRHRLSR